MAFNSAMAGSVVTFSVVSGDGWEVGLVTVFTDGGGEACSRGSSTTSLSRNGLGDDLDASGGEFVGVVVATSGGLWTGDEAAGFAGSDMAMVKEIMKAASTVECYKEIMRSWVRLHRIAAALL
jgi:hypothetical protein